MTVQPLSELWYTRCPVPTPLGIAVQLGWFAEEFGPEGIDLRSIQETSDPNARESHFDHNLPHSFRQGGNIPAIWARSRGADTRVIGLSWTDEFQAVLTLPGRGVERARDLRGRKIGLPVNPVSIDFNRASALRGIAKALELDGVRLDEVERIDTVNDAEDTNGIATGEGFRRRARHGYRAESLALVRGDVDAIYVKGALGLETARLLGATVVADLGFHPDPKVRINNGTPRTLTVDAKLIDDHPDIVSRFLARVVDAGNWARVHPGGTLMLRRLRAVAPSILVPLLLIAAWQAATATGLFPAQVLVPPSEVARTLAGLIADGELERHLGQSLFRLLTGFAAGATAGLAFGAALALSRWFEALFAPLFLAVRQVPVLAFVPMLVLLLGIDEGFKIFVVAIAAFFPVALATFDGVRGVPRAWFEVARVYRTPPAAFVLRILIPATIPPVLTGLRLGLTRAWLVLVAAELLAADSGLGQMMEMGRQLFRIDVVLAGVIVSGLVGFALDRGAKLVERRATRWRSA